MVVTVKQTTAHLPASARFEYWQDTVFAAVDMALRTEHSDFYCERYLSAFPQSTAIATIGSPFGIERHRRQIARDGMEFAAISTLVSGAAHQDQAGREASIAPGDLVLCDLGMPFAATTLGPYRETRLYVNRHHFEARVGRIDVLAGCHFPKGAPLVEMLTSYLAAYVARVPTMSPEDVATGLDGVLHLLSGLVKNTSAVTVECETELAPAAILKLAQAYIDNHLFEPGLDITRVKQALGISRTRLYEAFRDRGGVNAAIRDARLDRVRSRLCDPSDTRTIEQIARSRCFFDYPSFYRAFHRRFGLSPRDSRETARGRGGHDL